MHLYFYLAIASSFLPGIATTADQIPVDDHYSSASIIRDVLVDNEIIGDVLDDFEPSYYLDIHYPESHETVLLGNDIPVSSVQSRPTFTIHSITPSLEIDANSTFTLALTDPDAKSRNNPKWSEMCHWLITNLTASTLPPSQYESTKKAGELKGYKPPGPPPKTGPHRYVFILLEGDGGKLSPPKKRQHWGYGKKRHGARDWAEENGLEVVGANFFFAENEKQ